MNSMLRFGVWDLCTASADQEEATNLLEQGSMSLRKWKTCRFVLLVSDGDNNMEITPIDFTALVTKRGLRNGGLFKFIHR